MSVRTRSDVTSLVAGVQANAEKLVNLTGGVADLVQSAKEQLIGYTAVTKRLEAINTGLLNRLEQLDSGVIKTLNEVDSRHIDKLDQMDSGLINRLEQMDSVLMIRLEQMDSGLVNRLDQMNPFFVSMFVLLADVALSTSPRFAIQNKQAFNIVNHFRQNITTETERNIFDKHMLSVFQWYMYSNFSSSCKTILESGITVSGVYPVKIPNTDRVINVYCDQETDGGGWLVIQRRQDGSENFQRSWSDYKQGFGDVTREFWLGNEYLHQLTRTPQELRVEIMDFDGNSAYAKYSSFQVGPESEYYKMAVSGYRGTARDSLEKDNGGRFYVVGQDNECVDKNKGPWWRKSCLWSNLNGIYSRSPDHDPKEHGTHLSWYLWKSEHSPLNKSEIKIRPLN